MKKLFEVPHRQAMSDAEFQVCQRFIDATFMISNWPRDNFEHHGSFLRMVRKSYKGTADLGMNIPWRVLKAKHDRDNVLPGFMEANDKCFVAFFELEASNQSTRRTDWTDFTVDFVRSIA